MRKLPFIFVKRAIVALISQQERKERVPFAILLRKSENTRYERGLDITNCPKHVRRMRSN